MDAMKLVFIGPSGVGKTTLRKIFFEQINPLKLLKESLEPTYGIETAVYDVGKNIAIHDLAGQQLDEWIEKSDEVLIETDLILLIVEANKSWEEQTSVVQKVATVVENCCSDAYFAVLFHKIDLLNEKQRRDLQFKINEKYQDHVLIHTYTTSIVQEFFFNTFRDITHILRKSMSTSSSDKEKMFSKLMVLNQFITQNEVNLEELEDYLGEETKKIQGYVDELKQDGYLVVKESIEHIALTEKGRETFENVRNKLIGHLNEEQLLKESKVRGLIISDHHGKSFLTYEIEPDFYAKLVSDEEYGQDPQLISMFFSAVLDFGKTIDKDGFNQVILLGEKYQICIIVHKFIAGIFISEGLDITQDIRNSFRIFITNFCAEFREELKIFHELNGIHNIESLRQRLKKEFVNLSNVIKHLGSSSRKISQSNLIDLYMDLETKNLPQNVSDQIKDHLFKYTVSQDKKYLKKVDNLIEENM